MENQITPKSTADLPKKHRFSKRNKIIIAVSLILFAAAMSLLAVFLFSQNTGPRLPTDRELADAYYEAHKDEFYVPSGTEGEDLDYINGVYPYDHRIIVEHGPMQEEYSEALLDEMPVLRVIFKMIDAAKAGDAEAYNACFTDEYRMLYGDFQPFTPQKLYAIRIKEWRKTSDGGEIYSLSYCIKDNDGSLRRDMVEGPRDMLLTIVKRGDEYLVTDTSLFFILNG